MTTETKEKIQYGVAIGGMILGTGLCIADFILPPLAEMHDTSLILLGEFIGFASAVFGISLHYENQLNNFKQQIKNDINKKD